MALITRVTRLFRADMHAVLDRLEEPDVLLRQAVREMEEELARDERQLRALDAELGQAGARHAQLDASLARLAGELDVCFAADNGLLARALIRRRLEAQRMAQVLSARAEQLGAERAALCERVDANRRRLEDMRQKAELFAAEEDSAREGGASSGAEFTVRDEDVEVAFLAEQQRRARP